MLRANLLIPMAGAGSRFFENGYTDPKPLIDVFNKKMINWVVGNFDPDYISSYTFIVRKEHDEKYNVGKHLIASTTKSCNIVTVDHLTEGAACTTLLGERFINKEEPLLLANSDQFVEWDFKEFYTKCQNYEGNILTFYADNPKWSYAKVDEAGIVQEVAEKKLISNHATVGIYYWSKGSDYVKYAKQMISKNIRTNNEFYVCPVYNEAIQDNKKIGYHEIPYKNMWGLGTPEDLKYFLENYKE